MTSTSLHSGVSSLSSSQYRRVLRLAQNDGRRQRARNFRTSVRDNFGWENDVLVESVKISGFEVHDGVTYYILQVTAVDERVGCFQTTHRYNDFVALRKELGVRDQRVGHIFPGRSGLFKSCKGPEVLKRMSLLEAWTNGLISELSANGDGRHAWIPRFRTRKVAALHHFLGIDAHGNLMGATRPTEVVPASLSAEVVPLAPASENVQSPEPISTDALDEDAQLKEALAVSEALYRTEEEARLSADLEACERAVEENGKREEMERLQREAEEQHAPSAPPREVVEGNNLQAAIDESRLQAVLEPETEPSFILPESEVVQPILEGGFDENAQLQQALAASESLYRMEEEARLKADREDGTKDKTEKWIAFFQRVKSRPAEFYQKCADLLLRHKIDAPEDLASIDFAAFQSNVLEAENVTTGQKTFLEQAMSLANADAIHREDGTKDKTEKWIAFFQRVESRPAEFYQKCADLLLRHKIDAPEDLASIDFAAFQSNVLEAENVTTGQKTFLEQAMSLANADAFHREEAAEVLHARIRSEQEDHLKRHSEEGVGTDEEEQDEFRRNAEENVQQASSEQKIESCHESQDEAHVIVEQDRRTTEESRQRLSDDSALSEHGQEEIEASEAMRIIENMTGKSWLDKAIAVVNAAQRLEAEGKMEDALQNYKNGIVLFEFIMKREKSAKIQETIRRKIQELASHVTKILGSVDPSVEQQRVVEVSNILEGGRLETAPAASEFSASGSSSRQAVGVSSSRQAVGLS